MRQKAQWNILIYRVAKVLKEGNFNKQDVEIICDSSII